MSWRLVMIFLENYQKIPSFGCHFKLELIYIIVLLSAQIVFLQILHLYDNLNFLCPSLPRWYLATAQPNLPIQLGQTQFSLCFLTLSKLHLLHFLLAEAGEWGTWGRGLNFQDHCWPWENAIGAKKSVFRDRKTFSGHQCNPSLKTAILYIISLT